MQASQRAFSLELKVFVCFQCAGIVAIGYVEQGNVDVPKLEKPDEVEQEVYSTHRVLIWSLTDAFKPKV